MITLIHGLGSRVKNISLELTNEKPDSVAWTINRDCPVGHREIFPNGINGIEIIDTPCRKLVAALGSINHNLDGLPDSVNKVFDAMQLPKPEKYSLGIVLRPHFWKTKNIHEFCEEIRGALQSTNGMIPTLCGSNRFEIMSVLGERGISQLTDEMAHDLDRPIDSIRKFLLEWWRVLNCETIISNTQQTTLIWPHKFINLKTYK